MFVSIVLFIISIVFMILAIIISKAVKEINAGLQEADTAFDELDSKKGRIIQFFTKPFGSKKIVGNARLILWDSKNIVRKVHHFNFAIGIVSILCFIDVIWSVIRLIKN